MLMLFKKPTTNIRMQSVSRLWGTAVCRPCVGPGPSLLQMSQEAASCLSVGWHGAWNLPITTLEPQLTHWSYLSTSEQQRSQPIARNNDYALLQKSSYIQTLSNLQSENLFNLNFAIYYKQKIFKKLSIFISM